MSTSMLRNSAAFGGATLVSRLLGMLRDIAVSAAFGAGAMTDAFYVAFRFANLFRAFFAEGAFSQAFIPNLARVAERDPQQERLFIGNMLLLLGGMLALLVLLVELGAEQVVRVYALGYSNSPEQLAMVVELLRISMPYILLISLAALLSAVLQSHQRFFISGISPILLNLCMIAACLFAAQWFALPIAALAWASLVAGVLQLVLPWLQLVALGKLPRFSLRHWHPAVKQTALMLGPVVVTASITQVALTVDTLLATFLETGSVTWLYIANRLIGFPLGIFGISIAVVVLPSLSRARAAGESNTRIFGWASQVVFSIGMPAACGLAVAATPIVITLFQYGQFTLADSLHTAGAVRCYALGLVGMMFMKIVLNSFLASGDAKTPLRVALLVGIGNICLSLVLMQFFGYLGLALSTACSSLVHAGLLYGIALRNGLVGWYNGWLARALRLIIACLVLVITAWLVQSQLLAPLGEWGGYGVIGRLMRLALLIGACGIAWLLAMLAMGWRVRELVSP